MPFTLGSPNQISRHKTNQNPSPGLFPQNGRKSKSVLNNRYIHSENKTIRSHCVSREMSSHANWYPSSPSPAGEQAGILYAYTVNLNSEGQLVGKNKQPRCTMLKTQIKTKDEKTISMRAYVKKNRTSMIPSEGIIHPT